MTQYFYSKTLISHIVLGPRRATQAQEPRPGRSSLHTGRVRSRVHRKNNICEGRPAWQGERDHYTMLTVNGEHTTPLAKEETVGEGAAHAPVTQPSV